MDDSEISQSIKTHLGYFATEADCAVSLSKALEYVMKRPYCLLIMDFQMSCIGNEEMLRIFRVATQTPILALTDALDVYEKIALFHAGVNAFLDKPVDVDLCIAQANALIKLYLESNEGLGKSIPITFGTSLVIAPRYRQVLVNGKPLELMRMEFDLRPSIPGRYSAGGSSTIMFGTIIMNWAEMKR